MSAAAILASPIPVAAGPAGDTKAAASVATDAVSAFADMVAAEVPAEVAPAPVASTADEAAPTNVAAEPTQGLLSSALVFALQPHPAGKATVSEVPVEDSSTTAPASLTVTGAITQVLSDAALDAAAVDEPAKAESGQLPEEAAEIATDPPPVVPVLFAAPAPAVQATQGATSNDKPLSPAAPASEAFQAAPAPVADDQKGAEASRNTSTSAPISGQTSPGQIPAIATTQDFDAALATLKDPSQPLDLTSVKEAPLTAASARDATANASTIADVALQAQAEILPPSKASPRPHDAAFVKETSVKDATANALNVIDAPAQVLDSVLPIPKASPRPLDAVFAEAAPIKPPPANASTLASPTASVAPSADVASTDQSPVASIPVVTPPPAPVAGAPAGSQPTAFADARLETTEPALGLGQTLPAAAAATDLPTPVTNSNSSLLSQATVETTVQIAAQITRRLDGRSTRFEMGLTPEGLGRVDVSLDIDSGGKLTARLAFDNPLAATELRGRADELRRELQDAGFTIAQDGLDFSERQSSPGGGFDRRQSRAFAGASRINADADLSPPSPAAWVSLSLTPRGVDMKV